MAQDRDKEKFIKELKTPPPRIEVNKMAAVGELMQLLLDKDHLMLLCNAPDQWILNKVIDSTRPSNGDYQHATAKQLEEYLTREYRRCLKENKRFALIGGQSIRIR